MLVFLILSLAGYGLLLYFILSKKKEEKPKEDVGLKLILEQVNELSRMVDSKIGENTREVSRSLQTQFGESQKLVDKFLKEVSNMTEKVTRFDETGKQIMGFADQLQNLQDVLKNPKQRGILGEYYLENALKNVLPPGSFQMQYPFKDGTIVDAAVFVKDKIIPIDSKFSLENYNRLAGEKNPGEKDRLEKLFKADLKKRIDETSQYIKPDEKTMDFAFMFIPHEAIYYDLLVAEIGGVKINTQDLIDYAFKKKVLIVSPTSFLAFLQTVLQGLKALQIEESAILIRKNVESLQKHLRSYGEYHDKVGGALSTVVNHFNNGSKEFKKIDKDVMRITGGKSEMEILELPKPILEGAEV